jgi:hypothetical protein
MPVLRPFLGEDGKTIFVSLDGENHTLVNPPPEMIAAATKDKARLDSVAAGAACRFDATASLRTGFGLSGFEPAESTAYTSARKRYALAARLAAVNETPPENVEHTVEHTNKAKAKAAAGEVTCPKCGSAFAPGDDDLEDKAAKAKARFANDQNLRAMYGIRASLAPEQPEYQAALKRFLAGENKWAKDRGEPKA